MRNEAGLPLRIRDLEVRGDDGRPILSVPSHDVAPGTALGICGPSGAGKSTLLMALAGLLPKMSGSVRWGETDLARLRSGERSAFRRRAVGMIFQDFLIFDE
ncbi:MAG: ATP-binding cassette domain-containing protein, partial [Pseudomonadota bacterium]